MKLLLRLFLECPPGPDVLRCETRLATALVPWQGKPDGPPQRYWKMTEWVEFTFQFEPATPATFNDFLAHWPDGWTHYGDEQDRSSVWNPGDFPALIHPGTRWAELILGGG